MNIKYIDAYFFLFVQFKLIFNFRKCYIVKKCEDV